MAQDTTAHTASTSPTMMPIYLVGRPQPVALVPLRRPGHLPLNFPTILGARWAPSDPYNKGDAGGGGDELFQNKGMRRLL